MYVENFIQLIYEGNKTGSLGSISIGVYETPYERKTAVCICRYKSD